MRNLFVHSVVLRLLPWMSNSPSDLSTPHHGHPIQPQNIHSLPHQMADFLSWNLSPPSFTPTMRSMSTYSFYSSPCPRYSLELRAFVMAKRVVFSHGRIGDLEMPGWWTSMRAIFSLISMAQSSSNHFQIDRESNCMTSTTGLSGICSSLGKLTAWRNLLLKIPLATKRGTRLNNLLLPLCHVSLKPFLLPLGPELCHEWCWVRMLWSCQHVYVPTRCCLHSPSDKS